MGNYKPQDAIAITGRKEHVHTARGCRKVLGDRRGTISEINFESEQIYEMRRLRNMRNTHNYTSAQMYLILLI